MRELSPVKYLESQRTKHPTAVCRAYAGIVAVDDVLAGCPGPGDFHADSVNAPAAASLRVTLYPLELAGDVVATRRKLGRAPGAQGPRAPHSRERQLLASGQLAGDAPETACGFAATFLRRALALEVILAGRRPRRAHILLVERRASAGRPQRWFCKM